LCPVRLTKIYFEAMSFKPGADSQDTKHLHCKLHKLAGRRTAAEGGPASQSKGCEELKVLLSEAGRQGCGITDKSYKMMGVTRGRQTGMGITDKSYKMMGVTKEASGTPGGQVVQHGTGGGGQRVRHCDTSTTLKCTSSDGPSAA
jgi:hypothetical protein